MYHTVTTTIPTITTIIPYIHYCLFVIAIIFAELIDAGSTRHRIQKGNERNIQSFFHFDQVIYSTSFHTAAYATVFPSTLCSIAIGGYDICWNKQLKLLFCAVSAAFWLALSQIYLSDLILRALMRKDCSV